MCVYVCACVSCVCARVCMRVLGGACFILKPRAILVAKLDSTAPPTSCLLGRVCPLSLLTRSSACVLENTLSSSQGEVQRAGHLISGFLHGRAAASCPLLDLICTAIKYAFSTLASLPLWGPWNHSPVWCISCFPCSLSKKSKILRRML